MILLARLVRPSCPPPWRGGKGGRPSPGFILISRYHAGPGRRFTGWPVKLARTRVTSRASASFGHTVGAACRSDGQLVAARLGEPGGCRESPGLEGELGQLGAIHAVEVYDDPAEAA